MRKIILPLLAFCILLCSHDMFLIMDTYFLEPGKKAQIDLYNGTFDRSDNTIDRDRMIDVSLMGNGNRQIMESSSWTTRDSITVLDFTAGDPGTYVAGVSTRARNITLEAEKFNNYLEHDGVLDMLQKRRDSNQMDMDATERYSKHVKAIYQVGDTRSGDWAKELGYPIEFVPLSNPYEKKTGDALKVRLLRDGKPLANQLVYADYKPAAHGHSHDAGSDHSHDGEHSHDGGEPHNHDEQGENHTHTAAQKLTTDNDGVVELKLTHDGIWYLRTIHMMERNEDGLTHESNWSTLTFEVSHAHDDAHDHDHDHEHEDGLPDWIFWVASVAVLFGLYFFFRSRKTA